MNSTRNNVKATRKIKKRFLPHENFIIRNKINTGPTIPFLAQPNISSFTLLLGLFFYRCKLTWVDNDAIDDYIWVIWVTLKYRGWHSMSLNLIFLSRWSINWRSEIRNCGSIFVFQYILVIIYGRIKKSKWLIRSFFFFKI